MRAMSIVEPVLWECWLSTLKDGCAPLQRCVGEGSSSLGHGLVKSQRMDECNEPVLEGSRRQCL